MATSSLLATTLVARNVAQKDGGGVNLLRKGDAGADFKVSSNSAFRKPIVREDQSVAKRNCVDDSNSVAAAVGAPRPVIGNPDERSLASTIGAARGKVVLSFMEKA